MYTALLTQNGGNDFQSQSSGPVQKGVTYFVDGGVIGLTDFSNVGGQLQTDTTGSYYFVATINETPNEYGGATADYNTGAPVVTVLENTIGNIWFTYSDIGLFVATSNELFTNHKTICFLTNSLFGGGADFNSNLIFYSSVISNQEINIISSSGGTYLNTQFSNTPIEIRIYN